MVFVRKQKRISKNTDMYTYYAGDERIVVYVTFIQGWANISFTSLVTVTRYRKKFVDRYEWHFDEASLLPAELSDLISAIEHLLSVSSSYDDYEMVNEIEKIYCRKPRRLVEVLR